VYNEPFLVFRQSPMLSSIYFWDPRGGPEPFRFRSPAATRPARVTSSRPRRSDEVIPQTCRGSH